jgi:type VI secretion system secreted protein VgrG
VSFHATEKMRAPTEVRIVLTHPLKLACSEYLSRDAVLSIVPDDGSPRKFSGFIERFSTIQNTKDYVKYEIVLKSHFGRLAAVTRRNIFQQASTPDILHDHELREHQFHFCLRRPYPKPAFRIQHGMSDQNYAHMADQYRGNADTA